HGASNAWQPEVTYETHASGCRTRPGTGDATRQRADPRQRRDRLCRAPAVRHRCRGRRQAIRVLSLTHGRGSIGPRRSLWNAFTWLGVITATTAATTMTGTDTYRLYLRSAACNGRFRMRRLAS